MRWGKGYAGLSILIVLFAAAYVVLVYNSQPTQALPNCNQDFCNDPYYCGDEYSLCSDLQRAGGYAFGGIGYCPANCVEQCIDLGDCCTSYYSRSVSHGYACAACPSGTYWDGSQCSNYCGNGVCDNGETYNTCPSDCPVPNPCNGHYCGDGICDCGETSSCSDCKVATTQACCGSNMCQYYSDGSSSVLNNCVYPCHGTAHGDECGVWCDVTSCNTPPASSCSGDTAVSYSGGGTCTNTDCSANGCSSGYCSYSTSNYDCNSLNQWVAGSAYNTCENGNVVQKQPYYYYDYGCSGGGCYLANSQAASRTDTTLIQTCSWGCSGASCNPNPCAGVSCPPRSGCDGAAPYTETATPTVSGSSCTCPYSRSYGTTCPTSGCADGKTSYTGGCSGGSCYTNNNYCGGDYWTCSDSETKAYLSNYCASSTGSCQSGYSQQYNCNSQNYCTAAGTSGFCSGSSSCTRQNYNYVDFGCSSGSCIVTSNGPSGSCPSSDSCSPCPTPTPDCSGTSRCTYTATCSGSGTCSSSSSCTPCTAPAPDCADSNTVRTYSPTCSGGSCGTTSSLAKCPSGYGCSVGTCVQIDPCLGVNCPSTGCSGEIRQYNGYCSSGDCTFANSEDCNSRNSCSNSGSPYLTCSGSSVVSRQDRVYNDYTCSSGSCVIASTSSSGNCPPVDTVTDRCNSPPAATCSNGVRTYYDTQGTCSGGSCVYTPHTQTCTYGCSGSNCAADPCLSKTCPGTTSSCFDANTKRTTSYTCNSANGGSCDPANTDTNCQFGCANGACNTDPCQPNPCNSPPENICSGNTLMSYPSTGVCTASGSSAVCSYSPTSTSCQYGCLSLPGPDQCAGNSPPALNSISLITSYQTYARSGQAANVYSSGSDPNNEQVRLRCGTSSGSSDLCTSSYAGAGPSCSFANGFSDSVDHNVYCFLEDSAAARSSVLTTALSSDNIAPSVSISRSPTGSLTPGTTVTLTATAGDSRSGVSSINIIVDGYNAAYCSSITCTYMFTPSYGQHNYYANAYDNVENVAWTDGTVNYPGPGPNGDGTTPPPGTRPGEGTTPPVSPPGPSPAPLPVNDAPTVLQPISYTGACKTGSTITLKCTSFDANQAANTLSVKAWAGECNGNSCFATRSWISGQGTTYLNSASMASPNNGGTFTKDITITQADGTSIAATCQATDSLGASSNFGDAYPICTVNSCPNPPVITISSISPNPSGAGAMQINFSADKALQSNPAVTVKPGSQAGGTQEYAATFVSKNGNSYVYSFTVQPSMPSGIADVKISGTEGNCPFSQISQATIDTMPPLTSISCGGAPCSSTIIYRNSVLASLVCSDMTGCDKTKFGVDGPAGQLYSAPFTVSSSGIHTVIYQSNDTLGNMENLKTQTFNVYAPQCKVSSEAPSCNPHGFIDEEIKVSLAFDKSNVVTGDTVGGKFYCFLRDKATKAKTRDCSIAPSSNGLKVLIDKGTAQEKMYFNYYKPSGSTSGPGHYTDDDISRYLNSNVMIKTETATIDGLQYLMSQNWAVPLDTNIFHTEVCVNITDGPSGLNGQDCQQFGVQDYALNMNVAFSDVNITVPLTTDGANAPNFTKLMPINFQAVPYTRNVLTSSPCTGVDCRVDFSFSAGTWPYTATWNSFDNAYEPKTVDVASNSFACNSYQTLFARVTDKNGVQAIISKQFFINCNTAITITPIEKRLVLGAQPGNIFTATVWNPSNSDKTFDVASATANANGYPLQWIKFDCTGLPGCQAGPVQDDSWLTDDDKAILIVPSLTSRSVNVLSTVSFKSGVFPVTFNSIDTANGNTYSTAATILVFAEGLDEFAAWQLFGFAAIVAAILLYFDIDMTGKSHRKRGK